MLHQEIDFLKLARTRYATKRYNPDKIIPQEKVEQLKEILRLTPSSINCQPWRFTFVQNPETKARLADVSMHNTNKINGSELLIVFQVMNDLDAFQEWADTKWEPGMAEFYNSVRPTMSEEQIKGWFTNQLYIALGFCMAACAGLGLDSTPMEGIEQDKYAAILNSAPYWPRFAVCVGYRADDDNNEPDVSPKTRRPLSDVVESI